MTRGASEKRILAVIALAAIGLSACQTTVDRMATVAADCPQLVVVEGRTTFLDEYEISEQESRQWGFTGWRSGQIYRIEVDRVLVGSLASRTINASILAHSQLIAGAHRIVLEDAGDGKYRMIQTLSRDDAGDFRSVCTQVATASRT